MKNYLVVGQGLAGMAITEMLLRAGHEVTVVSNKQRPSSTSIATGMYNPIVFRRLNKSWMVDTLLPFMHTFYETLQTRLGIQLDERIAFYKRISNDQHAGLWEQRRSEDGFAAYMGGIREGFGEVFQAGIIQCAALEQAYAGYLDSEGRLMEDLFDHHALDLRDAQANYRGITYQGIVFCEGPHAVQNPFFNWLPFHICKGEWVVIETERQVTERVINNIVNIIPLGENRYKLSSTYSWTDLDWKPTTKAEKELTGAFEELFDEPYRIVACAAGLRPTVSDRRPFIGTHPEHKMLHIFNGLGSKGVMLAPYFARHLCDHLCHGSPLMPEVDIVRHFIRYAPV